MTNMNFPSTPELWNQIAMILAWYWDQENDAEPEQVVLAIGLITTAQAQPPNKSITADEWWLLLDALGSYKGADNPSWNDELEDFYKIVFDNYWKLTLPDAQKTTES